ncbi:hypothetical protein ACQPZG_31740 [Streptomyces sp. CA-294286]|uniref:hypothetical protein n=1 Tax=Streptomyces sp. CA-294286 TaxID=3240070 RepID=UPI003D919DC3
MRRRGHRAARQRASSAPGHQLCPYRRIRAPHPRLSRRPTTPPAARSSPLSTPSCIARPTETGFTGIYVHYDGVPSVQLPFLLTAQTYRFGGDHDALASYLIDIEEVGWEYLGDDLLFGAPDRLRDALANPDLDYRPKMAGVLTQAGAPAKRMEIDEANVLDSEVGWVFVVRPEGIEVINPALGEDLARGPLIRWDHDPLARFSDHPGHWSAPARRSHRGPSTTVAAQSASVRTPRPAHR